jgi:gamma-glutamyltranspeptidase / glutathione hydrolase
MPIPLISREQTMTRHRFLRVRLSAVSTFVLAVACALGTGNARAQSASRDAGTWHASGKIGAVVAGGAGAVDAGIEILKSGGNATDAAVATILALTVTDAASVCFGGEVPILIYDARTRTVEVIAGQGAAPALATREFFAARGGIPGRGLLPAAVPGLLDACLTALDRHGTITFAAAAQPMLRLLDRHQKDWHANLARTIRRLIDAEGRSAGDRRRGLRLVADCFYRGPLAHEIGKWVRAHDGLLDHGDLARHVTRVEEPVTVGYRGFTVHKCGPWTQGPFLLQTLQMLEHFDLKSMGHNSADAVHVTVEAMKLALADRDMYYADPLYEDVPLSGLLAPSYAEARRGLIEMKHASLDLRPGDPLKGRALLEGALSDHGEGTAGHDTTTCLVADREGNLVAATPSGWSGVVVGETGVWLGTRLQSFNIWPGHPDCIAPGKRPRITLTPTIVTKDRKPVLAVSVAGGDNQDQMTLQLVLNHIDFGLDPAVSVRAPRFMSDHFIGSFRQAPPDLGGLRINPSVGQKVLDALASRGHKLKPSSSPLAAAATVIAIDQASGLYTAAGDPRARRHAAAF